MRHWNPLEDSDMLPPEREIKRKTKIETNPLQPNVDDILGWRIGVQGATAYPVGERKGKIVPRRKLHPLCCRGGGGNKGTTVTPSACAHLGQAMPGGCLRVARRALIVDCDH